MTGEILTLGAAAAVSLIVFYVVFWRTRPGAPGDVRTGGSGHRAVPRSRAASGRRSRRAARHSAEGSSPVGLYDPSDGDGDAGGGDYSSVGGSVGDAGGGGDSSSDGGGSSGD